MGRRPRIFAPGVLYHVIVRGNQRQKTFTGEGDYQAYLDRLGLYRRRYGVRKKTNISSKWCATFT